MSNEIKETLEAAAKIVEAVPVYEDALRPAATEAGQGLVTVARLVTAALRPVRTLAETVHQVFDRLDERLRARLGAVPPEQIVEPPANIAGPLLAAYPYAEGAPPLREMFEQLLATAMNSKTQTQAHPSFVEILKQLSSEEAQILHAFAANADRHVGVIRLELVNKIKGGKASPTLLLTRYENFESIKQWMRDRKLAYFDNLERLGLIEVCWPFRPWDGGRYDDIQIETARSALRATATSPDQLIEETRGVIDITHFGKRFIRACVSPDFLRWYPQE